MIKAVLTGHSRGLGAAIAEHLVARRIPILALARSQHPDLATRAPQWLREEQLDLSDTRALARWLDGETLGAFLADAKCAVLVNNAGLLQPVGPLGTLDAGAIVRAIDVNLTAPVMLANAFVAASADCPDRRVLHVSSGAAGKAYPGWGIYGATKAALAQHARVTAAERIAGLRIAAVAPGVVDTDMQAEIRATSLARFPQRQRFDALKAEGGLAAPADAARRLVDYLLSGAYGTQPEADLRSLPSADAG